MSYALNINILSGSEESRATIIQKVLQSFLNLFRTLEADFNLEEFCKINVIESNSLNVKKLILERENEKQVSEAIDTFADKNSSIIIEAEFPLFNYENEKQGVKKSSIFASIRFYSKSDPLRLRLGDIEISFDNVNKFLTTDNFASTAYAVISNSINGKFGSVKDINKNYDNLFTLIKFLVKELNPEHLLVGTADTEVNPITSHIIYHKKVDSFVRDLVKIAEIHEIGGFYFTNDRVVPPQKQYLQYGYLRGDRKLKNSKFLETLKSMSDFILSNEKCLNLSLDDIETCFLCSDVDFEEINESYLITSKERLNNYIESLYFCLSTKFAESLNLEESKSTF